MQDDTININGKPATDAQLRKLTGLENDTDVTERVTDVVELNWTKPDTNGFQHLAPCELWERHVAEKADRTVVTLDPFFWSKEDPVGDWPCWHVEAARPEAGRA